MKKKSVLLVLLLFLFMVSVASGCEALPPSSQCYFGDYPEYTPYHELFTQSPTYFPGCGYTNYFGYMCWGFCSEDPTGYTSGNYDKYKCSSTPPSYNTSCLGSVFEIVGTYPMLLDPTGTQAPVFAQQGESTFYNLYMEGTWIWYNSDSPIGNEWIVLPSYGCDATLPPEGNFTPPAPPISLIPRCSFTAEPRTGTVPFQVTFHDRSTNIVNPQIVTTYRLWEVEDSDTFEDYPYTQPTDMDWASYFADAGKYYDVTLYVGNVFGNCNISSLRHINTGTVPITTQWSLVVYPETVNPFDHFTAQFVSSINNFSTVTSMSYRWASVSNLDTDYLFDVNNPTYLLDFILTDGVWYQFDTATGLYSVNIGSAFPNPVYSSANFAVGTFDIINYFKLSTVPNTVYAVTDALIVTSTNQQILTVEAKDYLSDNLMAGTTISILNLANNSWVNRTSTTGSEVYYYPFNTWLHIEAIRSDYILATREYSTSNIPAYRLKMIMYPSTTPPTGNATLNVIVKDYTDSSYVSNAMVNLSDGQTQYTSPSGVATFTTLVYTNYAISVSKNGYQSVTDTVNSGSGAQPVLKFIFLPRISVTPTVTPTGFPTPTPTGTITPVPSPTHPPGDALKVLGGAAYDIMVIVKGLIFIWLMWMTLYIITGGKIIDKIMKRGRR